MVTIAVANGVKIFVMIAVGLLTTLPCTVSAEQYFAETSQQRLIDPPGHFDWNKLTPLRYLKFHDCYDGFQCARLEVPMDWNLPSSQKQSTVVIALAKLPAGVAPDDPRYGGPILLNPGGPGGSGVDLVLSSGRKIQRQVNPNHDKKHRPGSRFYDILGFDPRGVNNTTPTMSCFSNAPSFRRWKTQLQAFGLPGSSNTSFMQAWAANSALSETCSRVYSSSSLGQHINTVPVARDMLEIVKQHADWSIRQGHEPNGLATDSKLRYIGYSYGTVLATVFASLWPMHVGKMVLDGVVDTMDYYAGHWFEAIGDADQVPAHFAEACAEAGSACAFFDKPNYVKPSTIFERFRQTLDGLLENPLAVSSSTDHDPDVITFSDFINYLRDWSYGFSSLSNLTATFLRDIAAGNGSSFATYKQNALDTSLLHQNFEEAKMAIECSDMPVLNITAGEYSKHYWNVYRKQSWFLGDRVSVVRMMCNNWRLRPKWQFDSSFSKIMEVSPVLLVSNTFDPVTPVRNTRKLATQFSEARVLELMTAGHCSLGVTSSCLDNTLHNYFQKDALPAESAVCHPDFNPFLGPGSG